MCNKLDYTVVILNYNDSITTINLLNRIKSFKNIAHIIVVDNCSTDDSVETIRKSLVPNMQLFITDHNGGYGYGNNFGVKKAYEQWKSEYVLIVNPDVYFNDNVIKKELTILSKSEKNAIIAPCQLDINHHIITDIAWKCPTYFQYTFCDTGLFRKKTNTNYDSSYFDNKSVCYVDCVPGSLLLIRTQPFLEVGGYDEDMFLYCEETTIGLKLKHKGYKTLLDLEDTYVHEHSVSINKTFKSELKKYKLLVSSRLKVIKKYLSSNMFKYYFAVIIYKVVILKKKIRGFNHERNVQS